ncbi:adenylate kinase [Mucilaginibacter rigui]|uniref:Adenylate kinase n=1 Tax=Mucilaginibacter rigui TaxID=534635 RepID=A0ABR7XB24_9SPHI|nr:shikimate kinase [Mucilaginibacter rigui]MBD1387731.1 adenylate kinase [Mucilaginibacter rigui]
MKIHVMGASCAGSTTLGRALAQHLNYTYFDTDEYFWLPSAVPYTIKRETADRIAMLKTDLLGKTDAIVGGSLVSWGNEWLTMFDLVVFLYTPHDIRMERLHTREVERYGDQIFTDPFRADQYKKFTDWAKGYDDNTTNGRNLAVHQLWLSKVNCPVLKIEGDTTVAERIDLIMDKLQSIK